MDVIEELDIILAFVSAINIKPDLSVEYLPVSISKTTDSYLFPHIFGKPWAPYGVQCGDVCIWVYNGYITALTKNTFVLRRHAKGYYESIKTKPRSIKIKSDNAENMILELKIYIPGGSYIRTRFGEFEKDSRGVFALFDKEQYLTMRNINILPNTYYNYNGEAFPGGYYTNLAMLYGAPAGYFGPFKEPIRPKIFRTSKACKSVIDLHREPPELSRPIPFIRNINDLYLIAI